MSPDYLCPPPARKDCTGIWPQEEKTCGTLMADHLSNLLEIEFQTGVSHVQRIYIMSKY